MPLLNADVYAVGFDTLFDRNNARDEDVIHVEEPSDIVCSEMFLNSWQIKAGDRSVKYKLWFRT